MHVVALERGTPGERYILGGENLTLKQILDRMSAITGLPSPTMKVPHAVAMAFAFFDENFTGKMQRQGAARYCGSRSHGEEDDVCFFEQRRSASLAFRCCRYIHALRSAIDWFVAHGYAPALRQSSLHERVSSHHCGFAARGEASGSRLAGASSCPDKSCRLHQ